MGGIPGSGTRIAHYVAGAQLRVGKIQIPSDRDIVATARRIRAVVLHSAHLRAIAPPVGTGLFVAPFAGDCGVEFSYP